MPLLTSAEMSAQRRRLPSVSYNLPALGALRDKVRPIRYFFCASSLCSASD